ncbi:MAG TPA: recombination mediator RecR [Verrucomicrobiota bacterium]|nr:recombination mediator RecR [Verrucomicrobiota bacterium]
MATLPAPLAELIGELGRLPGIGPRSAERLALHLVQADPAPGEQLAATLTRTRRAIVHCARCGALAMASPCGLCDDPRRDAALLCVVERAVDILALERAGAFRGQYLVLGGKISPLNGVGPEDLRVAELERRVRAGGVQEVILALGSDVEGDATSHYLAQRLGALGAAVTRLAQGLPAGSGLDFADELTLARALEGRRPLEPGAT